MDPFLRSRQRKAMANIQQSYGYGINDGCRIRMGMGLFIHKSHDTDLPRSMDVVTQYNYKIPSTFTNFGLDQFGFQFKITMHFSLRADDRSNSNGYCLLLQPVTRLVAVVLASAMQRVTIDAMCNLSSTKPTLT